MLLLRPEFLVVIASEAKIMSLILVLYCAFDSAKFTGPNLVQQWTNKAVGAA